MADNQQPKFPSELIDLPSGGRLYPEGSPLRDGKIELKYMTAREEDILTSQNLLKKGVVIDTLLNSLIMTKGITCDDLLVGDKNAVMVAARILGYGPEYVCDIIDPNSDEKINYNFNLSDLEFKTLPTDVDYTKNEFEFELPTSKVKIIFKLLIGRDEKNIEHELNAMKKVGTSKEVTTRLKHAIVSVGGETDRGKINNFVDNMLSRDSLSFRKKITDINPDIILEQEIELGGEAVTVDIPMTAEFFWPTT